MKIKGTIKYFILLTATFVLASSLLCMTADAGSVGTNRAEFLLIGAGARPASMGEAFTAVADDVNTISYNPAGLGTVKDIQFTLMHNEWIDDIGYEYAGFAYCLGRLGTAGLELKYLHTADITGRGVNGKETANFSVYSLAATLAYGKKLAENLSVGSNIKLIQEKIEEEEAVSAALDLGVLFGIDFSNNRLQIGVSVQNIGPETKFVEKNEPMPLNMKVGTAYRLLENSLLLAVDGNISEYAGTYLNAGAEYKFIDIASARIGYKSDSALESAARFNVGLGIGWKDYSFDYTFVPFDDLGQTHRFAVMAKFGHSKAAAEVNRGRAENKSLTVNETMQKIIDKIADLSEKREEVVLRLSDKYIYFEDSEINIEHQSSMVYARLLDVLTVMYDYKIEFVGVSEKIKSFFIYNGINKDRIIHTGLPSPEKAEAKKN